MGFILAETWFGGWPGSWQGWVLTGLIVLAVLAVVAWHVTDDRRSSYETTTFDRVTYAVVYVVLVLVIGVLVLWVGGF